MKAVRSQLKKQRVKAESQLTERLELLVDYRARILQGEEDHRLEVPNKTSVLLAKQLRFLPIALV